MRKTVSTVVLGAIAALSLAAGLTGCGSGSTAPTSRRYVANLTAANEGAGRTSPGSGVATFVDRGSEIDWTLSLTNMTGVFASHIHGPAAAGVSAGVIFNLFLPVGSSGTLNGVVATGSLTSASNGSVSLDSLRTLFNNGMAYVNVHTSANQAGEIRDQVRPAP